MNRILFRGKSLLSDQWEEGFAYEHNPPLQCIVPKDYQQEPSQWYICKSGFADWNMPRPMEVIPVAQGSISQFSGVIDTNSTPIFEHDVIKVTFELDCCIPNAEPDRWVEFFEVVFDDVTHTWYTKTAAGDLGEWLHEYDDDCVVVGNLYDTPNLLEQDV